MSVTSMSYWRSDAGPVGVGHRQAGEVEQVRAVVASVGIAADGRRLRAQRVTLDRPQRVSALPAGRQRAAQVLAGGRTGSTVLSWCRSTRK